MQDTAGRKRFREEKSGEALYAGQRCSAEVMVDESSLGAVVTLREARRSDISDTFPAPENVDDDFPEVPAHVVTKGQKLFFKQYKGFVLPGQRFASMSGRPLPAVGLTRHAVSRSRLGGFDLLQLQHQLIQLDVLEQELLNGLRNVRREYDARVVQLCGGLGVAGPAATSSAQHVITALPPQSAPMRHPLMGQTYGTDIKSTPAEVLHLGMAMPSGEVAPGAMPPPPPRPRGGGGSVPIQIKKGGRQEPGQRPLMAPQEWCPEAF